MVVVNPQLGVHLGGLALVMVKNGDIQVLAELAGHQQIPLQKLVAMVPGRFDDQALFFQGLNALPDGGSGHLELLGQVLSAHIILFFQKGVIDFFVGFHRSIIAKKLLKMVE